VRYGESGASAYWGKFVNKEHQVEKTNKPSIFARIRTFVTGVIDHYRHYERPRGFFATLKEFAHISFLHIGRAIVFCVQSVIKGVKYVYGKIASLFKKADKVETKTEPVAEAAVAGIVA
jgi:hypothetical protein